MTNDKHIQAEVERHYRHNFIVNFLDGTFFWSGASFIAARTILPLYVSRLTDSELAIGLLSTITASGWLLPQLFTANWIQGLPRKKVAPVNIGFFTERLPVFLMVPTVLLAVNHPTLALILFFIMLAWRVIGAGVVAVGWQDMIAKIIPTSRRGRFFGATMFSGTALGVVCATIAAWFLEQYSFPFGYLLCFAAASIFIFLSWFFMALTREPAQVNQESIISQSEYWRRLPTILRTDQNFQRFLLSQVVIVIGGMAFGFLAVYAVQRWQLADSQAGNFTTSMLIGQAISNLIFGVLADRKGHKLVLELSTLGGAIAVGLACVATAPELFYIVFALIGVNTTGIILSGIMIVFEFGRSEIRPTYIGLNNTVLGIVASIAPIFGGWLASTVGYQMLFAGASVIGLVGFVILHWLVQDPRNVTGSRTALDNH
jgi:MFS family permease